VRSPAAPTSRWRRSSHLAAARLRTSTRARTRPSHLLEGELEFHLGEETVKAGPGDFVNVTRGLVHNFRNVGTETARMVLTFTPAGIEKWFEETLEPAPNVVWPEDVPDNIEEVAARYVEAAPATASSSSERALSGRRRRGRTPPR
jgi:hypothetical protein